MFIGVCSIVVFSFRLIFASPTWNVTDTQWPLHKLPRINKILLYYKMS